MTPFDTIYNAALDRSGGIDALERRLPRPKAGRALKKRPDAYFLSEMTHRIFQAGLNRRMIDNKWPAFEALFDRFDIHANRMRSDEQLEALMHDRRIVRHWGKIQSVRHNAQTIHDFNETRGGFANTLADWPTANIVEFWALLKREFKQLGGTSGPYFLRRVDKDTFLLSDEVIRALAHWGVMDSAPKNRKQRQQAQEAMNLWHEQSRRPYCQISMILALSVD